METLVENLETTIAELLEEQEIVRLPATLEEYFDLIQDNELYDIEFYNHEIIVKMSTATDAHELLVATVIRLLGNNFLESDCRVYGSNRPVYVPECDIAFNADVLVVKGPTELFKRERKIAATLNPRIVVEVLSDSNKGQVFNEKLACYKKIPTLHQIIQVNQYKPEISVYTRTDDPHLWLNHDYDSLEMSVQVETFELSMKEIYRNLFWF
jgi:Uma2 family endonuclease